MNPGRHMRSKTSFVRQSHVVALVAIIVGATACSGGSNTATTNNSPLLAVATFAPDSLDPDPPGFTSEQLNFEVAESYVGHLMAIDPSGKPAGSRLTFADLKPELADGMPTLGADQKSYTFKLKTNIVSNVGNPLVADDVVWTLQHSVNNNGVGALLMVLANYDLKNPATTIDDHTVKINLTAPSPIALDILDQPSLGIIDATEAKKHVTSSDPFAESWLTNNVASFGPYTVSAFTPKDTTTLVTNPHFSPAPHIPKVVWKQVPDSASRVQLLLGASANYAWQIDASSYSSLKSNSKVNTFLIHPPVSSRLVFNMKVAPFTNPLVRQAVNLAIDRTALANVVFPGGATPAVTCAVGGLTANGAKTNSPTADATQAKALLAQAGYPNGFTMSIAVNSSVGSAIPDTARLVQSQLAAVGITANLNSYPTFSEFLNAVMTGSQQALIDVQSPFVADTGYYLEGFLSSTSPVNYGHYANSAFDTPVFKSMASLGSDRDSALLAACNQAIDDVPEVLLVNTPTLDATASNVSGIYDYPDFEPRFADYKIS
jgi:peptide/nickel transport system substrate-binding protein